MTSSDDGLDAEPTMQTEPETVTEPETDGATPSSAPHSSTLRYSLLIAAVVVVLDQWSKRWALNALADGRSRHVIWTLDWNLTFNSGMAFSRAQGIGPYIGVVALIVIVVMLLSVRRSGGRASTVAVGLVVGGAMGNLIDRLFRGEAWLRGSVIDFIDFRWWPIFNVADMGITIGGALLLLAALFDSRQAPA